MLTIDWILIVLWVLGTLKGWARGMVRQAVSIVGIILGFLLAKAFCSVLGATLAPESEHPSLVSGACFVLIWLGVPIALGSLANSCQRCSTSCASWARSTRCAEP